MNALRLRLAAAMVVTSALVAPASAGKKDNSVRFAFEQVLENADPYFNSQRIGVILSQQVWDTLIYRDPKSGEYKGQLASAWKWLDDKTLDVELRKGVKFHDGAEFGADDVVYTLNIVSKPENKASTLQNVEWIDRVEKVDKHRVRIITKRPFPAAIEYLAGPLIIHPHEYYAKVGPQGMSQKPVGSGPYRVVEHALGKFIRLERNPDYFKDSPKPQPKIATVDIRFLPDKQTQVAEAMSGGLDLIMNVAVDQAEQMRAAQTFQVVVGETMRIFFLQFNTIEQAPSQQLRDIRVRKAILHAIDRERMVGTIVGEGARVIHTVCFPDQFGCTDQGAPRYAYDPPKAKQLLAEAGLANGFDIDLYAWRERQHNEAIIGYLHAIGIKANLRFVQFPAAREAMRTGKGPMAHYSWGSFSINDVSAAVSVFYKGGLDDVNRDAEVRALLERGDSSMEPKMREDAYAKALALIQERAYALPLYSFPTYYVGSKDLGFTAYPDEMPRFWEMSWK